MSLLPHATNANPTTSYFALATDAGGATERAEAFIARNAAPGVAGFFAACGDASGATDAELFEMRTGGVVENTLQWTMGMSGTPAGADAGNDFVITAYNDVGAPINTPFSIERATGTVTVGDLAGGDVGGGELVILGTAGASRVFDAVYNPPAIGDGALMFSQGADGTIAVDVAFIPAVTGTYVLSATVNGVGSGWSWGAGNSINFALLNGSNVVPGGQIYIAGLVNPTGMAARGNLAADTFEYQTDILVSLTAGVSYDIARGSTGGAYNLGAGGSIGISIANLNTPSA